MEDVQQVATVQYYLSFYIPIVCKAFNKNICKIFLSINFMKIILYY
jgi:hypothetical protein